MIIKEFKPVKKAKKIILGFPGVGMVGSIASEYIIHKLGFEEIGHIRSEKLPALAIIRKSRPEAPIRIYKKGQTVILVSDIMIPDSLSHEFAAEIVGWIGEKNPDEVVILGGSQKKTAEKKAYVVSWKKEYLSGTGLEEMKLGYVAGIYGPLMMEMMEKNLAGYMILAEAEPTPDTGAAAKVIKHLSSRMKMRIDAGPLEKAAKEKKIKGPSWDPYPSIYG